MTTIRRGGPSVSPPKPSKPSEYFKEVNPPPLKLRPDTGYASQVVSFRPGPGSGFHANDLSLVLGRPEGAGESAGSMHVVSLGSGGQMTLKLGRAVTKGLKVFENGFGPGGNAIDPELARVEVSPDGKKWYPLRGFAGQKDVYSSSQNNIPPISPQAGGDGFLFRDSNIPAGTQIQYVRLTDLGMSTGPLSPAKGTVGFDLDAVYGF